jgi:hypothetical protein
MHALDVVLLFHLDHHRVAAQTQRQPDAQRLFKSFLARNELVAAGFG